jgi:translation initiation factor IF-3
VNERIRVREVRVIDDDGKQLGVMPPWEALKIAREKGLDLVEISPSVAPPVCKIMDYGRYMYQQNKKAHEARKHQKVVHIKEVKFRPATDEHDFNFKRNHIIRFLTEGDKVRAIIVFRGREMAHQEMGRAKLRRLIDEVSQYGVVEVPPRLEQNLYSVILAPKKGAGPTQAPAKPTAAARSAPGAEVAQGIQEGPGGSGGEA